MPTGVLLIQILDNSQTLRQMLPVDREHRNELEEILVLKTLSVLQYTPLFSLVPLVTTHLITWALSTKLTVSMSNSIPFR